MSRELDAEVAEKVMGWHVERFIWEYDGLVQQDEVWITDPSRKDEPPPQRHDVTIAPRPFSTDIAAAWQVVERIHILGFPVTINNAETGWVCTIGRSKATPIWAETIELAICRAAIQALEGK